MSADPSPDDAEPGRRSLLATLGAFAALALVVTLLSLGSRALRPRPPPAEDLPRPEITAFLGPLAAGERFGGYRVARIEPSPPGRITLDLQSEAGEPLVVDIQARSPAGPPGIADTPSLSIYLRTKEKGGRTPEAAARACLALAAALRAREETGHPPPPLESLAPRR